MGQIVIRNQKPKYCNLDAITVGSMKDYVLPAGEIWLVDTTNLSKVNGNGKYDKYIIGDNIHTASELATNPATLFAIDNVQQLTNVNVNVDATSGTPSGTASVSGTTLTLSFSGLKGAKGDTGETGATGPAGPAGTNGVDGAKGDKGDKGDTGPAGPQGPQGLQGIQGPQGPRGNDGNTSDSPIVIVHQVDKDTTYEPTTDVVGPDVIQNLKASDIKLENEDLVEPTVADGFEELINGRITIDVTGGTIGRAKIATSNWNKNGSYYCGLIPISKYVGKEIIIVANESQNCYYAFTTSDEIGNHGTAVTTFATGYTTVATLTKGNSIAITVPADATHLYLQRANTASATDISLLPSNVYIESALQVSSEVIGYNNKTAKAAFDELYATKEENENAGVDIDIDDGDIKQKRINAPTWSNGSYCTFIDISEYVGQEMTIVANSEKDTYYTFVTKNTAGTSYAPVETYAKDSSIIQVLAGETDVINIPEDASYLYLLRGSTNSSADVDRLPSSVTINGNAIDISGGTLASKFISYPTWTTGGSRMCSIIPLNYPGRTIFIAANDTNYTEYAFLTSDESGSNGGAVSNFAKHTGIKTIAAGSTVVAIVPDDATHLYVLRALTNSTTDLSYAPTKIFIKSALKLDADAVNFSDNYYKESNVQKVLEEINKDVLGVEVLDTSTFEDSLYLAIKSPAIYLFAGDTVTVDFGSASPDSRIPVISRYYDEAIITISKGVSGQNVYEYTATKNTVVVLQGYLSTTFKITRVNKRIDTIEKSIFNIIQSLYNEEFIGSVYKPTYTSVAGYYIKDNLSKASYSDGMYTSPISLKQGEIIKVYYIENGYSRSIITLSDSEGNLIESANYNKIDRNDGISMWTYRATEDCYVVVSSISLNYTIYVVSNNKIQDYMDAFDEHIKGTSILDFYANRETENMLRQLTWGYNSNLNLGLTQHKPLCLLHFSDIHNNNVGENGPDTDGVSNSNRIVTFFNKYKKDGSTGFIDDAIHTGDSVYATAGGNFPWTQNEDIAKVLNVIGNHDLDRASDWSYIYNKFFAPYVDGWGVTVPDDAATEGKCYYYKDYTTNNVRLIVLMDWMWLGSNSLTESYHNAQNTWFQSVLDDARTQGLTVVCAAHVTPQRLNLLEGCTFNSWECAEHADAGSATANRYADSVDAFIQAGGDFACWIGGHTHFDLIGTLQSYPDQFCILVENASCWSYYDTDHRITGTLSQDCFNVMSIDSTLKRVNVMRIGSNFASAMQHKGAFSYDYKQKKLLNCW